MKTIAKFYFDSAKYLAGDDSGHEVLLNIDYRGNSFSLSRLGTHSSRLMREAKAVAKGLLKRKHGINFASSLKVY